MCTNEYVQPVMAVERDQSVLTSLPPACPEQSHREDEMTRMEQHFSSYIGGKTCTYCKVFLETLINHFKPD